MVLLTHAACSTTRFRDASVHTDTDTASYVVKERPPEFRRRMSEIPLEQVCVSAITEAELLYGLNRLPDTHRIQVETIAFPQSTVVLDWPASAAASFARIKYHLVSTGQRIGEMDLLIAAHALDAGLLLVTGNVRHHGRVPDLEIVNWRELPAGR